MQKGFLLLEKIRSHGIVPSAKKAVRYAFELLFSKIYAKCFGIRIGKGTVIKLGARIRRDSGDITIGSYCIIHEGARLLAYGGQITIGDNVSVNPLCVLYGHGGLEIGSGVLIATGTVIVPANHQIVAGVPIRTQKLICRGIRIGDDVWIGAGVRVLDGSTVESGVVVGAGSVITGGIVPRNSIVAGIPARKIGERLPANI
ncbi:acyltransferase [Mesorhizobium tianshanense]|uniref:Acetyltransferase-like isoleucine patch superfamily enzyme n=1 Tax=Mesorhizobium tianshanense TaxID=39844 RepID=A0A562NRH8_9HYPH|nr:acyltransferase [Mesorhizobium tianshanense]TWI34807.1 acetyltransferase-like isoleucine patch superfamily enzyme [Mesorhizobium tianshanense]